LLHLQKRIRDTYQQQHATGAQIVIFGKKGHAEVIDLEGQTNNTAIVVENRKDVDQLDFARPIYLFAQTTKSVEEFEAIVAAIQERACNQFEYHNTICKNVANRVKRLQAFAESNDVVIFVGGQKSSNAKVLYNNCLEVNPCTIFVSSTADITAAISQQCHEAERVGICGATSTPKWLMEQVKQHIENNGI
jgi:4-hydroxy-3-methylbut-2-enyl diphosphate reductase